MKYPCLTAAAQRRVLQKSAPAPRALDESDDDDDTIKSVSNFWLIDV